MQTANEVRTTAYFNIARRNHQWTILGILHLSDEDALSRFESELNHPNRKTARIRPEEWGIKKALKSCGP